jgi:outer membrane protein assembly factor BamA
MKLIFLWINLSLLCFSILGQGVVLVYPQSEYVYFGKITGTDSTSLNKKLKNTIIQQYEKGFLEYSIDSVNIIKDTLKLYVWRGKQYSFLPIQYTNTSYKSLPNYEKSTANPKLIQLSIEKSMALYMQKGYPFAKCNVSYQVQESDNQHVRYQPFAEIETGDRYAFDSVIFKGVSPNAAKLAQNIVDIHSKDVFNQKKIDNAIKLLNNSPYFEQCTIKELRFMKQKTTHIIIETKKKKSNYIDGILGIAPSNAQQDKTQVTGNLKLNIVNPDWGGKILNIQWDKLASSSQNLEVLFRQPYLFQTPVDIQFNLTIQKQDTTFLRRDIQSKASYRLSANWALQGGVYNRNSYSTLRNSFRRDTLLSPLLPRTQNLMFNFKQTLYSAGIKYFSVNNIYAPQKGMDLNVELYTGYKNISKTQGIDAEIFETIEKKSFMYSFQVRYWQYIRFKPRQIGVLGFNGSTLGNPYITINDLYRVGGLKTLRGFNELSYFASSYAISTLEYRYFLEELSFFSLFLDYAWVQENYKTAFLATREINVNNQIKYQTYQYIEQKNKWNNPIGFGIGMQLFMEKAGILSLAIALGKDTQQNTTSVNFRQIKLHFGILTRF